jgi:ArsR family transcriptional regulator
MKAEWLMMYDLSKFVLIMKSLTDETRLKIIIMLMQGELCACRILEDFSITQPTLSHHMKILKKSGLVNSRRDGKWTKYTINRQQIKDIGNFLKMIEEGIQEGFSPNSC